MHWPFLWPNLVSSCYHRDAVARLPIKWLAKINHLNNLSQFDCLTSDPKRRRGSTARQLRWCCRVVIVGRADCDWEGGVLPLGNGGECVRPSGNDDRVIVVSVA